jgi:hypothetical protein
LVLGVLHGVLVEFWEIHLAHHAKSLKPKIKITSKLALRTYARIGSLIYKSIMKVFSINMMSLSVRRTARNDIYVDRDSFSSLTPKKYLEWNKWYCLMFFLKHFGVSLTNVVTPTNIHHKPCICNSHYWPAYFRVTLQVQTVPV